MYNLPSDSSINGCPVYHEGNHDDRGFPHEQYLSKIPIFYFSVKDTGANKYVKIANINYTINSNIAIYYKLKFLDSAQAIDTHTLDIRLHSNTANTVLLHAGSDKLKFYGIQTTTLNSDGTTQYNLDIYVLCSVAWAEYYYQVESARSISRADLGYDDSYAYRHITLFNNQGFISSIAQNVNETLVYNFAFKTSKARLVTDLITAYEIGKLEYCEIPSANANGFPENQAGLLITYRGSSDAWSYQEYHIRQTNKVYKRFWNTTTNAWDTTFVKISAA